MRSAFLVLVAYCFVTTAGAAHADPVLEVSSGRFAVEVSGLSFEIPIARSASLPDTNIETLIIVIHGSFRDANDYLARVENAIAQRPDEVPRTLVLAPQFLKEEDVDYWSLPATTLFWSGGWRTGSKSLDTANNARPARISSYAVLDQLLVEYSDPERYPNLSSVVIVGHSAGGQFVQRFAAGSLLPDLSARAPIHFVVANPGSYLYHDAQREVSGSPGVFALPSAAEQVECPGWNDYKYGLQSPNTYLDSNGVAQMPSRYASRHVRYLLGELDTGSTYLDVSCAAMLQGDHRRERGSVYLDYLAHRFGGNIMARHGLAIVPGVGHDPSAIFASEAGLNALLPEPARPVPALSHGALVVLALGIACFSVGPARRPGNAAQDRDS